MQDLWLLLIYTVPAQPSRKRAAVWRALKRLGAVYLRDGVAALPQRPDTRAQLHALAEQIEDLAGEATLVESVRLPAERAAALVAQGRAARAAEYRDILEEAERFLAHLRRETEHRDLGRAELEGLENDLGKVKAWIGQVRGRDYVGVEDADRARDCLARCDETLAALRAAAPGVGRGAR